MGAEGEIISESIGLSQVKGPWLCSWNRRYQEWGDKGLPD